jgi:hypothetical protein
VLIHVNSDKNIRVDDRVMAFVQGETDRALRRYAENLTRVDFHITDVNSHKFGLLDKRCLIEARPSGHPPVVATMVAPNVRSAVTGSLSKLRTALERYFSPPRKADKVQRSAAQSGADGALQNGEE